MFRRGPPRVPLLTPLVGDATRAVDVHAGGVAVAGAEVEGGGESEATVGDEPDVATEGSRDGVNHAGVLLLLGLFLW